MSKRYRWIVIHPGWVESKTDGDRHYIHAGALARLYGVSLNDPRVSVRKPEDGGGNAFPRGEDVAHLYPLYDGDYRPIDFTPTDSENEEK